MMLGFKTLSRGSGVPKYRDRLHYATIFANNLDIEVAVSKEVEKKDKIVRKDLVTPIITMLVNGKHFQYNSVEELQKQLEK